MMKTKPLKEGQVDGFFMDRPSGVGLIVIAIVIRQRHFKSDSSKTLPTQRWKTRIEQRFQTAHGAIEEGQGADVV